MAAAPFAAARDIFFRYDGSTFYMSRDNVEFVYRSYDVPKDVEERWLAELATRKLALLNSSRNAMAIHYFTSKGDVRHLQRFVKTEPRGDFGWRCAYVEDLLRYIKICLPCYSSSAIQEALECALRNAKSLAAEVIDEESRTRANRVVASVLALSEGLKGSQ